VVCELLGGVKAPKRSSSYGSVAAKGGEPVDIHYHHTLMPAMSLSDPQPEPPRSASPRSSDLTRGLHPPLRASWGVGADACIPPEMPNSCSPRWGLDGVPSGGTRDCEGLTCDGELAAATSRSAPTPRTRPTPGVQTHYPMSREVRADVRSPTPIWCQVVPDSESREARHVRAGGISLVDIQVHTGL
jgi:hypothetical protein